MPFTFTRTTGRWDRTDNTQIKFKRKWCGVIEGQRYGQANCSIRFMIIKKDINEYSNSNCKWRWWILKTPKFQTIDDAKPWINENEAEILKLNIYLENE